MKKYLFLSVLLLLETNFYSVSYASMREGLGEDPFIVTTRELTSIDLISEKFTKDLSGYKVPLFTLEKNRNHFDDRPEGVLTPIKSLVMHYTVCNYPATMNLFTKDISDGRVSSTYVITQMEEKLGIPGGKVVQIAPEEKRTWHAGVSKWREIVNLNGTSIGIENINEGFIDPTDGPRIWYPFDKDQIHSLGLLSQAIVKKYNISAPYVVGHADIAPERKQDPGIFFPWGTLYKDYGVGAWLSEDELDISSIEKYSPKEPLVKGVNIAYLSTQLRDYGYNIEPTGYPNAQFSNGLKAFKAHFTQNLKPERYNDIPDEKDMFWSWVLNAKYK